MTVDWKKKLLPNLPYLLFVYLFDTLPCVSSRKGSYHLGIGAFPG